MKKSRYSEAQIVSILKEAENGVPVSYLCRTHGMSSAAICLIVNASKGISMVG
jgi:putative transposase